MKTLNKMDLTKEVARTLSIPDSQAGDAVQAVLNELEAAFQAGQKVELRGFGIWKVKDRAARTGRNPKTGAVVAIPAKRKVVFRYTGSLGAGERANGRTGAAAS